MLHPFSITATACHFQFQFSPHYLSLALGIFGDFWCLPCVWYGQFLNAALVVEHVETCSMSQAVVMRFDFEQCATNWCENWFRLHVTCLPNCCTSDINSRGGKRGRQLELVKGSWGYPAMCCVIIRRRGGGGNSGSLTEHKSFTNQKQLRPREGGGTYQTRPLWG